MSYYLPNQPQAYRLKTSTVPASEKEQSSSSSTWVWIVFIVLLLLVIAGLIVWLALSYRRNPADRRIELAGANVEVSTPTTITATWNKTSGNDDVGTLYATLDPPIFNSSGQVTNASTFSRTAQGQNTATVSKLQEGLKYYATLVITSNGTTNYASYIQLVYMAPAKVEGGFAIQDILQVGRIEIDTAGDSDVFFRQTAVTGDDFVFTWNESNGRLESNGFILYVPSNEINNDKITLRATNDTSDTTNPINSTNSSWIYNHDGLTNRWCLNSTTSDTNPKCLQLGPINSQGRQATVFVTNQSDAGDAWVNWPELEPLN